MGKACYCVTTARIWSTTFQKHLVSILWELRSGRKCSWSQRKKERSSKEGWLTLPVIPRRPRYPLTHHEQDQELVTDHLERRRTHDQQQPGQHFQPAHSCLVVSRIWLVADQLQWKHLSKLLEQGSLRVAGNACQLCSSECSAWRHHRDHLCLSSAPLTKPQARSRLR